MQSYATKTGGQAITDQVMQGFDNQINTLKETILSIHENQFTTDELYINAGWCVWHEGVRIYDDNEQIRNGRPGLIRPIEFLRAECMEKQRHNDYARNLIGAASIRRLRETFQLVTARIETERQLSTNFAWVAYNQGKLQSMRELLHELNFEEIRNLYATTQNHNPNAKNLLAAVSNDWVRNKVEEL